MKKVQTGRPLFRNDVINGLYQVWGDLISSAPQLKQYIGRHPGKKSCLHTDAELCVRLKAGWGLGPGRVQCSRSFGRSKPLSYFCGSLLLLLVAVVVDT